MQFELLQPVIYRNLTGYISFISEYYISICFIDRPLPESAKTEENRIHGCASKLWLIGGMRDDGSMMYQVDGDAHISKGTAKVVTDIVNGAHRSEVANLTVENFTPLGIKELLTMQRQNGLGELIDRIIRIAHD